MQMTQVNPNSLKELNSLIKAVRLSPGFSLLISSFNNDNYRDNLIEKISNFFTKSTVLEIKEKRFVDFAGFENHMASLSKQYSVIHIVNKGKRFYKDTWPDFYKGLNYHREKIARENPVVIILWMRPEDVKDFALTAPDMWHWRGGIFDFDLPVDQFWSLENDAEIEKAEGRCDEIILYLKGNPDIAEALKASLYQELGELYYALGDYKKSQENILAALDFFIKKGEAARQESLYRLLESIEKISAANVSFKNVYEKATEIISLKGELSIAARVQQDMLPNKFPPFPHRQEFDIYAKMIPTAAMLGGDFYDFFFLDEERLAFAVGDVAGKGIPAALSMVKNLTLFRINALKYRDPGECLRSINNELLAEGENVSGYGCLNLFYGVLNIQTGELKYSCAGNPAPFIIRDKGKSVQILSVTGMPLGVPFNNADYEVGKIQLEKLEIGDIIFAFTDGIVDTQNPKGELFDTENLITYFEGRNKMSLEEMVEGLLAEIKVFAEGLPQSDDITVLALRFN